MRRLWSCVIVAVLALFLFSTATVGAGGKRSYTLTDSYEGTAPCVFQFAFSWSNYPPKQTYTENVWVEYDGAPTVFYWEYPSVGGSGSAPLQQFGFNGTMPSAHTLTFRATLTTEGAHPRVVLDASYDQETTCGSAGD